MNRFQLTILCLLIILMLLIYLSKLNLPPIYLPKIMQHNNIGELPIVEVADDGDFFEKDGKEYSEIKKVCIWESGKYICSDDVIGALYTSLGSLGWK